MPRVLIAAIALIVLAINAAAAPANRRPLIARGSRRRACVAAFAPSAVSPCSRSQRESYERLSSAPARRPWRPPRFLLLQDRSLTGEERSLRAGVADSAPSAVFSS